MSKKEREYLSAVEVLAGICETFIEIGEDGDLILLPYGTTTDDKVKAICALDDYANESGDSIDDFEETLAAIIDGKPAKFCAQKLDKDDEESCDGEYEWVLRRENEKEFVGRYAFEAYEVQR